MATVMTSTPGGDTKSVPPSGAVPALSTETKDPAATAAAASAGNSPAPEAPKADTSNNANITANSPKTDPTGSGEVKATPPPNPAAAAGDAALQPAGLKLNPLAVEPPWLKISPGSTFAYVSFDNKPISLAGGLRFVQGLRRLPGKLLPLEVFKTMVKLTTSSRFKLVCAIGIGGTTPKHAKYFVFLLDEEDGKSRNPSARTLLMSMK